MKHQIIAECNILTAGFAVACAVLGAVGIARCLLDPLNMDSSPPRRNDKNARLLARSDDQICFLVIPSVTKSEVERRGIGLFE
jgi:hypothetical protein